MTSRTGRLVAVAVAVVLALAFAGCSAITDQINLRQALTNEGYSSVGVNVDASSNDVSVTVTEATPPNPGNDEGAVARVVWAQLLERFDFLNVTVNSAAGPEQQSYSFEQLQQMFGVRPAADDSTTVRDAIEHTGIAVIVGVGVFILVAGGVTLLIVLTVRRNNRKKRTQYNWYPGYPPTGPWAPYGPSGQWPAAWPQQAPPANPQGQPYPQRQPTAEGQPYVWPPTPAAPPTPPPGYSPPPPYAEPPAPVAGGPGEWAPGPPGQPTAPPPVQRPRPEPDDTDQ